MISRRKFITAGMLTAAGIAYLTQETHAACTTKKKKIGLQLYSVRDALKNDLEGTLTTLASIGYTWLELADYKDRKFYGKTPKEFKKLIKGLGMELLASHTGVTAETIDNTIEDHKAAGIKYIIQPWLAEDRRTSAEHYKKVCGELNQYGEKCKKEGLKFGYHNHAFEFDTVDGRIGYDLMLKETDPALVLFEMDVYWVRKGGADPLNYFEKFPGRFELLHFKDMDNTPEEGNTVIGKGVIDFGAICKAAPQSGMKYFFVELEKTKDITSVEGVKQSFEYLNGAAFIH